VPAVVELVEERDDFDRLESVPQRLKQAAEKLALSEGYGLQAVHDCCVMNPALAAEGCYSSRNHPFFAASKAAEREPFTAQSCPSLRSHKLENMSGFSGGRKEPQVTRRNQSRRDGTICSPARECRVGFQANRVPKGRHNGEFSRKLFSP
jgi:hypothetical protein